MKILRKANVSIVQWYLYAIRSLHRHSVFALSKIKQNKLAKTAQVTQVKQNIDIEQAIASALGISYGQSFIFRDASENIIEDVNTGKNIIENAFNKLANKNEDFRLKIEAYVIHNRPFMLGAHYSKEGTKNYLVPTFGGIGLTNLKSEFTGAIEMQGVKVFPPLITRVNVRDEAVLKPIKDAAEIVEMVNAAGYIVSKGTVNIGTIGSRSTNWDTSYNLHIDGVPSQMLARMLTFFTDISNEDVRNLIKKQSFDLTTVKEVGALMDRIGLKNIFWKAVDKVKDFEDRKGLKRIYEKERRIPDYKNKTTIEQIPLRDYADEVVLALLKKITSNPSYVNILAEQGISDPQEIIDVSFAMGQDGEILSQSSAIELLQAAA